MTEHSIPRQIINVDFLTDIHRISCQVEVINTGFIGLVNDVTNSLFTARNVYISRLNAPAKIVAHFDEAALPKATLTMGLLSRREDLGPISYLRGGASKVMPTQVFFTVQSFEIRAMVEVVARLDAEAILVGGGTGRYTVAYNATINSVLYPETTYSAPAMVINRTLVTHLAALAKGRT
jgi:hypothetical protein